MGKESSDWTDKEIRAAVNAYLDMLEREQNGHQINKAYENRRLREVSLTSRTKGSVEFRMQNISTVLVDLGRVRIKGYKPAKNVGANVALSIRNALETHSELTADDFLPTADDLLLEQRALKLEKSPIKNEPQGIVTPLQTTSTKRSYIRAPEVRAWIRQNANGVCEGCGLPAPFEKDGQPFLEVHHVKHLAQNGSDRISNAVALCPNCHKRCHFSSDSASFTSILYQTVSRLRKED